MLLRMKNVHILLLNKKVDKISSSTNIYCKYEETYENKTLIVFFEIQLCVATN